MSLLTKKRGKYTASSLCSIRVEISFILAQTCTKYNINYVIKSVDNQLIYLPKECIMCLSLIMDWNCYMHSSKTGINWLAFEYLFQYHSPGHCWTSTSSSVSQYLSDFPFLAVGLLPLLFGVQVINVGEYTIKFYPLENR